MINLPDGPVIIIYTDTDKFEYEHQTGGYACNHPSATGMAVVVDDYSKSNELMAYFTGPKWSGWCSNGIDEETANFIECAIPGFTVGEYENSQEAWIYGFYNERPAILAWENSD